MIALPDTRYTSLCIERMLCSQCDSGVETCKNFFHEAERDKLAKDDFIQDALPSQTQNFGAVHEHECGPGRKFIYPNGTQVDKVQIRCGWDEEWLPSSGDRPQCGYYACPEIPANYSLYNLETSQSTKDPVPFGGNITYACKEGYLFVDDIEMESHPVFCETNGSFSNLGRNSIQS